MLKCELGDEKSQRNVDDFFLFFIPPSLVTKLELVYCSSLCRIITNLYVKKVISSKIGNVRLHCGTSATILTVML